jgi:hypothetical protein
VMGAASPAIGGTVLVDARIGRSILAACALPHRHR